MTVFTIKPINQKAYPIPLFVGVQFPHLNEAQDNSAKVTSEWLNSTFPIRKLERIKKRRSELKIKQMKVLKQIATLKKELDHLDLEDRRLQRGLMNEHLRFGDLEKISAYKIVQILD